LIGDDERTKLSANPLASPDDQATRAHADVGIVAELRAVFGNGEKKTLPLYALPDQLVVGRGTACDWQLDDPSLSRKHCQFKWNGRQLSVEDLGSANGTRVGARSARNATPVGPDDVVQLGTVMISFVPLVERPETGERNIDAEATKLVAALPAGGESETTPSPARPPLSAVATVVKAPSQSGPPNARAAVFHPERDAAGPDEATRSWDPNAALVHAPEKAIDAAALMARLKTAWRTNRRPFVLGGAALWVALLLGLIALKQPKAEDDDSVPLPTPTARTSASGAEAKPVVTQLPTTTSPSAGTTNDNVVEPSTDRDQDLADAIAAYDNGRPAEALRYFRRLSTDPSDKVARFMVTLIESRGGGAEKTP
jgi:predicted component of type VI protein secretion system